MFFSPFHIDLIDLDDQPTNGSHHNHQWFYDSVFPFLFHSIVTSTGPANKTRQA